LAHPRGNRLLDALPAGEIALLSASARLVPVRSGAATILEGRRMQTVDFPITALMSVEGILSNGVTYELASVGPEGFVEIDAALESDIALRSAYCRFDGEVLRVPIDAFQANLTASQAFSRRVRRAVRARVFVTEQNQLCNLRHTIAQRLARWMLVAQERLSGTQLPVTHDMLATILGSRRASVTESIASLDAAGAISRLRGKIVIRNAAKLAQASCECYALCQRVIIESLASGAPA